jgi:hypothetical protein
MKELTEVTKRNEARPSEGPVCEPSICSGLAFCRSWTGVMGISCALSANACLANAGSRRLIPSQTVYEYFRSFASSSYWRALSSVLEPGLTTDHVLVALKPRWAKAGIHEG